MLEINKIYCGDCLELMKDIHAGSIDMILTDPPYEISNSGGGMMERDNRNFIKQIDSLRMCRSDFDINKFLNTCFARFEKNKFAGVFFCSLKQLKDYLYWIDNKNLQYGIGVWQKSDPPPLCNNKYLNDIEFWIYIKGKDSKISGTYQSKSLLHQSCINRKDKTTYGHPTIKPVELMQKFIFNHTAKNSVILDPFIGSGTTAVAAIQTHRNFIGIEKEQKYVDIANQRISQTQPELF